MLAQLLTAVADGSVEIVDLTAPLSERTPILRLPEPFANTVPFRLKKISRYDDRGPAWYWNDIETGEHVGTHFDAPVHWATGRDGEDVSQVPPGRLVAPAVVLDASAHAAADPDFLLEIDHVRDWEKANGPLPDGGWLLYRTGWDARSGDQESFLNADENGPHTPGISAECARWLAEETPRPRARHGDRRHRRGRRPRVRPALPVPLLLPRRRQVRPHPAAEPRTAAARGTVLVASPLPIVGGSGSPARVLALIER
ncbi:cyclase family protein [Actinomadura madurae]|uniref:cyclase family protein n=1 Tax=Actinomadura madurae TaxID=1993 RepID=UPI0020D24005|nr:cyclase family protein [Actinomadura madurae]MCQ0012883.1 cyclase family protein [Actinomadura madurae]